MKNAFGRSFELSHYDDLGKTSLKDFPVMTLKQKQPRVGNHGHKPRKSTVGYS